MYNIYTRKQREIIKNKVDQNLHSLVEKRNEEIKSSEEYKGVEKELLENNIAFSNLDKLIKEADNLVDTVKETEKEVVDYKKENNSLYFFCDRDELQKRLEKYKNQLHCYKDDILCGERNKRFEFPSYSTYQVKAEMDLELIRINEEFTSSAYVDETDMAAISEISVDEVIERLTNHCIQFIENYND